MRQQWTRLEAWLKTHNPALLADLNPSASEADIQALERMVGVKLPMDFVECLKVHDGQKGAADWLFFGSEFLSLQRIMDEWVIWNELSHNGDFDDSEAASEAGIQPVWWSSKWIPFSYNGTGDHLCLDLDPVGGGRSGQVITFWHDDGARKKKADSFAQWFADFVDKTV